MEKIKAPMIALLAVILLSTAAARHSYSQTCSVSADCNDSSVCTIDSCDTGNCAFISIVCNDSSACTLDSCDAATGCFYTAITCNDSNACTLDSCDAGTGCFYTPLPAEFSYYVSVTNEKVELVPFHCCIKRWCTTEDDFQINTGDSKCS